jgi:hypothetical protein
VQLPDSFELPPGGVQKPALVIENAVALFGTIGAQLCDEPEASDQLVVELPLPSPLTK